VAESSYKESRAAETRGVCDCTYLRLGSIRPRHDTTRHSTTRKQASQNNIKRKSTNLAVSRVAQSVQCLTTDWTTGVRSPTEAEDFSSKLGVHTSSGAHPASYTMGTGGSFPGGEARPGRDADHSPPSSAEVTKD
jgi:single-stranded DNA-binding protein